MFDGHGDDAYRYGGMVKHNFSSNIFQGFDHSELCSHLGKCAAAISNYPSPEPTETEAIIAHRHDVADDAVMLTAGATDAIYLLAQHTACRHSIILSPTFSEYEDACSAFNHSITFATSIDDLHHSVGDTVWICNPNNPTGKILAAEDILKAVDTHKDALWIIDASYAEYSSADAITFAQAATRQNLLLIKSMTKTFAVPGLRIGYIVGNPAKLAALRKLRRPWAVGGLEREAVKWLSEHQYMYRVDATALNGEIRRIAAAFRRLGIETLHSATNFMLCRLPGERTAGNLKEWLVKKHGILIRDASNFQTLSPQHFRVAAQTPDQNDLLINSLEEWLRG